MAYFVTDDGCKLYYEIKGQGEPLIFVHGWTCSRRYFKKQVEEFSKTYKVITYDLRGHGDSDRSEITEKSMSLDTFARDLRGLIDHLELDNVNVCGWSMGVSIILNYIELFENAKLKSACMIDMTPKLLADDEWQLGQARTFNIYDNLGFMELVATDWDTACEAFIPNIFAAGYDQSSDMFKWCMAQAKNNTPHCMLNMWIAMAVKDYRNVLPKINIPVLLAYSGDGLLYTPDHGKYMEEHIANATLDIFPGCGHGLFFEDYEKFNKDYAEFLKKC